MNDRINELETQLREAEIQLNRFKREERRFKSRRSCMFKLLGSGAVFTVITLAVRHAAGSDIALFPAFFAMLFSGYGIGYAVALACGIRRWF